MAPITRVLLVANRTASDRPLADAVRDRARQGPARFHLLVPAAPSGLHRIVDPEVAEARLDAALDVLTAAAGTPVTGHAGDADPLAAVSDALHLDGYDEVILSTLPWRLSRWLHIDLPHKVRALGVPVRHVGARAPVVSEAPVALGSIVPAAATGRDDRTGSDLAAAV